MGLKLNRTSFLWRESSGSSLLQVSPRDQEVIWELEEGTCLGLLNIFCSQSYQLSNKLCSPLSPSLRHALQQEHADLFFDTQPPPHHPLPDACPGHSHV